MKKVCLVLPNCLPVPAVKGGAIESLVENLIKENEKGKKIDITCVSLYDKEALEKSNKYKYTKFIFIKNRKMLFFPIKSIQKWTFFNRVLRKLKYNAELAYDKLVYNKIKKLQPDVIVIEGGDMLKYPKTTSLDAKIVGHIHGPMVATKDYLKYDYFLSVSNFIKNMFCNNIISRDKIKVVYNGIDTKDFQKKVSEKEKQELRNKYHISEAEKVLLFCGRVVKEKGIKELIQAFRIVLKTNNKVKLLIVGKANFKEKLTTPFEEELYEETKDILRYIEFTGYVDNNNLYKIYSLADIVLIPSIFDEAFCLVAEEAMASSLPIICSDSGALPEIMNRDNCIFVKRGNKFVENFSKEIVALLRNDKKRLEMSRKAKTKSEDYSVERFYNSFCQAINEIVEE